MATPVVDSIQEENKLRELEEKRQRGVHLELGGLPPSSTNPEDRRSPHVVEGGGLQGLP